MAAGVDDIVRELHALTVRHAQLRDDLERLHTTVNDIEKRFLARRPSSTMDEATERELKRKMVLSKPFRDELNVAYRELLQTTMELDGIVRRIHQCQGMIANHFRGG
jgi:DNA polymerase/3'-5' exonuclease PolX